MPEEGGQAAANICPELAVLKVIASAYAARDGTLALQQLVSATFESPVYAPHKSPKANTGLYVTMCSDLHDFLCVRRSRLAIGDEFDASISRLPMRKGF